MCSSPYYPFRQASYEALRATSLEWTRVSNGFFMDYWGIARGLKSYMAPIPDLAVDIAHKKAAIPGTGEEMVCMTYTFDVARYLAAFLADTESKWEETTYFFGDRITLNAFVKTAETATGESMFLVFSCVLSGGLDVNLWIPQQAPSLKSRTTRWRSSRRARSRSFLPTRPCTPSSPSRRCRASWPCLGGGSRWGVLISPPRRR